MLIKTKSLIPWKKKSTEQNPGKIEKKTILMNYPKIKGKLKTRFKNPKESLVEIISVCLLNGLLGGGGFLEGKICVKNN